MAFRIMTLIWLLLLVPAGLQAEPLFDYRDDTAAQAEPLRETLVAGGQHEVRLNPDSLLGNGELALPDNRHYRLDATAVRDRGGNGLSWHGRVRGASGEVLGTATFTVQGQRMAGRFTVGGRQFELVSVAPDRHVLLEHDPSAWPEPHPPSGPLQPAPGMVQADSVDSTESGTLESGDTQTAAAESSDHPVIDVTAVYTQALLDSSFQDEGGVRLSIRNAIDATNTAYINSEVTQRVRLVSVHPVGLNETTDDMDADLREMENDGDDEIKAIRDARAGDLIALIGGYQDSGNCGLGFIKQSYGNTSGSGYSVTRFSCLGNQTLAHELGHNMGLAHDPENSTLDASELIERYAFGYRVDGDFRTIMAYSKGCNSCPQIDNFSNPDVTTSGGTPTGVEDEHDNVRVMGNTAADMVAYREPVATLGEGLDATTMDWATGGGATWITSNDQTRDGEPVAGSGPIMDGEASWVETTLPEGVDLSFDWLTELSGTGVALVVEVDGTPVETYRDDSGEWQRATVNVTGSDISVRWQVTAPEGSDFDTVGRAYLTNVSVSETDNLAGTVVSSLGTPVPDVNVTIDTASGESGSAVTGDDGTFDISMPLGSVGATDEIQFDGEAMQFVARPAEECLNENGPCEQTVTGEARTVSGTVTGLISGEQFDMELRYFDADGNEQVAESETVTADGDGNASFSVSAESVVVYDALWAVVPGYIFNRYKPDGGVRPRSSDIDGIEIEPQAQDPVISNASSGNVTDSGFEVTADVDTRGRSIEVQLFYEGSSDDGSETITVQSEPGDTTPVSLAVENLDCGSYTWRLRAVSDTGTEDETAAFDVRIEGCGGGGSSGGCSIAAADSARPDPVLGALMLLALAGMGSRLRRRSRAARQA